MLVKSLLFQFFDNWLCCIVIVVFGLENEHLWLQYHCAEPCSEKLLRVHAMVLHESHSSKRSSAKRNAGKRFMDQISL